MQQASLLARVAFNLECCVIHPSDVEASRYAHDVDSAVCFALFAGGFVFCSIPCVGNFLTCVVERKVRIVALRRGHHSKSPIFGHDRNPVSCQVDERTVFGISRRRASALCMEDYWDQYNAQE